MQNPFKTWVSNPFNILTLVRGILALYSHMTPSPETYRVGLFCFIDIFIINLSRLVNIRKSPCNCKFKVPHHNIQILALAISLAPAMYRSLRYFVAHATHFIFSVLCSWIPSPELKPLKFHSSFFEPLLILSHTRVHFKCLSTLSKILFSSFKSSKFVTSSRINPKLLAQPLSLAITLLFRTTTTKFAFGHLGV